jgi:hypothetical protein
MNALNTKLNQQHDQAHRDARVLRHQALAEMWTGVSQHLVEMGHLAQQGAQRLVTRLSRSGRSSPTTRPLSRS